MPSVTYMNQSAPFWDFIAGLEQQGSNHPFFSQNRNSENENENSEGRENHHEPLPFGPWGWGGDFFSGRGFPNRGRQAPSGQTPNQHEGEDVDQTNEKDLENDEKNDENNDEKMKDVNDNGEGPSGCSGSDNEGCGKGRGRHGRCGGGRRRGHCGPGGFGGPWQHSGPRHGHHPHGFSEGPHCGPRHGPRGFGRRGGWGSWGRGGFGGGFDPSALAAHFWGQFNDTHTNGDANKTSTNDNGDHTPDVDIFDGETAFVVHVSLPGAKKEDVGVNWDAEKSELSVAGVIYRPGSEEFLRTLAMNERKVGPFERKIRLGTRATPAHIDTDGIVAKLEDGILRIEVPKLDSGYVEVRKVDIN